LNTRSWPNLQFDNRAIPNFYPRGPFCKLDTKTITLPRKIVALPADYFSHCLSRLPFKLGLLPLDPTQLADDSQAHRFVADPERSGNSNTPTRGVHPQVEILYVFPHNLDP
jgi:hypothetical protein